MNIASGNFDIGHYDNPGTPVHLFVGLVIYIAHLFTGTNVVYYDVLSNPELYLNICVYLIGAFLLLATYYSGYYVFKKTKNIFLALIFQLSPVSSYAIIHYLLLIRATPENLIIIILTIYIPFVFLLSYLKNLYNNQFIDKSHILTFSFISALLITTKITCVPLLVIPIVYITPFYKKIMFLFLTFLFSLIILFPIWPKFVDMYQWFTQLATHSGEYGQGEKGVSVELMINNFIRLLKFELFYTVAYVFITLSLILGLIKKRWDNPYFKFVIISWFICSSQLLLASKQFGLHYLIASQIIVPLGVIASTNLFIPQYFKKENFFYPLFFSLLLVISIYKCNQSLNEYKKENEIYKSALWASKLQGIPKIITSGYEASCFQESALRFGSTYGGRYFHNSNYVLKKLYPNSFFYDLHRNENILNWWDFKITPLEFLQAHKQVLFYFSKKDREKSKEIINKFIRGYEFCIKSVKLLKYNEQTGESFYLLTINKNKIKPRYGEKENWFFDFETISADKTYFIPKENNYKLYNTELISTKNCFSGNYSVKIPPGAYACYSTFSVKPGDAFKVNVKCFSTDRPVGITISDKSSNLFKKESESITEIHKDGWKTISFNATIPHDFSEKEIIFSLYYFGFKDCFVDDLNIEFYKNDSILFLFNDFANGTKVYLKNSNGKFVNVNVQTNELFASAEKKEDATVFEVNTLKRGEIYLQTLNKKIVCADRNKNNILIANRENPYEWETFNLIYKTEKIVTLKSTNNKYVFANRNENGILIADRESADLWEEFEVIIKEK